jgi:2-haloacid dehalogenase
VAIQRGGGSYDLVLLDADGTLLDFDAASSGAFRSACAEAGIGTSRGAGAAGDIEPFFRRYRQINHGIWEELERGEIDKETLKTERFRRLFAEYGVSSDPAAFSGRFLSLLSEGAQLIPGAESFVRALLSAGKRLAIVTNGISSVQRGRFARSPLGALIPELLISEELGAEKPAAAFFSEAFRRLGRPESEKDGAIVMGDAWSADVAGALGFGLPALWFNPSGKPRPDAGDGPAAASAADPAAPPPVFEARTYDEALLGILGR